MWTNTNTGFTVRHGYLIEKPDPKGSFQCAIPRKDRNLRLYGYHISTRWLEQNKLLVNLLEGKLRFDIGRFSCCLLFGCWISSWLTPCFALETTTAAPPPTVHRSTSSLACADAALSSVHLHLLTARTTTRSTKMDTPKLHDTAGYWSSTDAPVGRDWQTDGRVDGPPAAAPAPPRTYANTVRPARSPPSSTRRDALLPPIATDRLGRTQVIRRTEFGMTERDIIQTMTKQTGIPGHRLFESVLHDPRDRRRFYLMYATMTVKRDVMGRGFFLGGIHIRPTEDAIEGYIPYRPFYCDKQTLDGLLNAYGAVTDGDFVRTTDGIRISGYKFRLKPRPNRTLPTTLTHNGYDMDIRRNDDTVLTVNVTDILLDDADLVWPPRSPGNKNRMLVSNNSTSSTS